MKPNEIYQQRQRLEQAEKISVEIENTSWLISLAFNQRVINITGSTSNVCMHDYSRKTADLFCDVLRSYREELEQRLEDV